MIDTITEYQFRDEMIKPDNGFSYEGAQALFNYLEQLEEDCNISLEFDPVAIRCDYVEYENLEELNKDFDEDYNLESLADNTTVIEVEGTDKLIIQVF